MQYSQLLNLFQRELSYGHFLKTKVMFQSLQGQRESWCPGALDPESFSYQPSNTEQDVYSPRHTLLSYV